MTPQLKAFLDMIAACEIGYELLALSDNGYNVLVGSTPWKPLLFPSYAAHPRILNKVLNSTAAGRYQEIYRNYAHYGAILGLQDFSPDSQDAIATRQIEECRALPIIEAGNLPAAVDAVHHLWESLPGNTSRRQQPPEYVQHAFIKAGGVIRA